MAFFPIELCQILGRGQIRVQFLSYRERTSIYRYGNVFNFIYPFVVDQHVCAMEI